jgi:hydroxypyruvate isomerase
MLFTEYPFTSRPAAARSAGFRTVEAWWPADEDLEPWAREIEQHQLAVACLNAYGGDLAGGERGFLNIPRQREASVASVERALALGGRIGARTINVLAGRLTGDLPRRRQWDAAVAALRECADMARSTGITLVVENINEHDIPGYLCPTPRVAARLVEAVGSDAVRLLFDAYHAARAGCDPTREAPRLVDLIAHAQFADCPGRGAPGTGALDVYEFVGSLREAGYAGAIGLEYVPEGPTIPTLRFLGEREWSDGGSRHSREDAVPSS